MPLPASIVEPERRSRLYRRLGLAVLIFLGVLGSAYYLATISEPYEDLEQGAKRSIALRQHLGEVRYVRLSFARPFSFAYGDLDGSAAFTLFVQGDRRDGMLSAKMRKREGKWSIESMTIDDKPLKEL